MAIVGIRGVTGTGRVVSPSEMSEVSASITQIDLDLDDPRIPTAIVSVDPVGNDEVRYFTRHAVKLGKTMSVPVLEIKVKGVPVRMYLHPEKGPILSTQDLYF
jgi:hypothetical protein